MSQQEKKLGDCDLCLKPNEKEDMVQCDKCHVWLHFSCAGVNADVMNRPWECSKCIKKGSMQKDADVTLVENDNAKGKLLLTSKGSNNARSDRSSKSRARSIELELQLLEEKKRMDEKLLEEKKLLLKEQSEKQAKYLEQKFALLKQHDEDQSEGGSSVTTYGKMGSEMQCSHRQQI